MTFTSSRRIDAFDQWCLRHILRIPYTAHVTTRRLRLFVLVHLKTIRGLYGPTSLEINWTKTKIQVFDEDISQPSKVSVLGLSVVCLWTGNARLVDQDSAWKRAQERSKWRQLVETAMSSQGRATR